jgi:peptidoglycan/xylan/chitin deacetylase (PgdA/CDA1 family)
MIYLRAHYDVLPLRDLVDAVFSGQLHDRAGVAVTFDDGYLDNYSRAMPILNETGVPATFFVTTDRLTEPYEYWWDALERILVASGPPLPPSLQLRLANESYLFETETVAQQQAAHWNVHRALVDANAEVRDQVVASLAVWSGRAVDTNSQHRRMRADEIAQLERNGHVVASHSVHHLKLPLQPIDVQEKEIRTSRAHLEDYLGHTVTAFAYPFGASSALTRQIVRQSFALAVTCEEALLTARSDPWSVPRLEVRPHQSETFDEWVQHWLPSA